MAFQPIFPYGPNPTLGILQQLKEHPCSVLDLMHARHRQAEVIFTRLNHLRRRGFVVRLTRLRYPTRTTLWRITPAGRRLLRG